MVTAARTGSFFSRVPENWHRSNRRPYSGPAHGASSSGSSGSSSSSAALVGNVGATQGSASQANRLLPGATVATLLMLGALHARRLYEDSKVFLFFSYLSRNQVFFFPLFSHSQHPGSTDSEEFFYTVLGCIVFL
jgi:hypothetical protein